MVNLIDMSNMVKLTSPAEDLFELRNHASVDVK